MTYPLVIVPEMITISATTLRLLSEFSAAGGTVLRCGAAPVYLDGDPDPGLAGYFASVPAVEIGELASVCAKLQPPLVQVSGVDADLSRKLMVHVRDLSRGEVLVYLANLHRTATATGEWCFAGTWRTAWSLDTATGDPAAAPARHDGQSLRLDVSLAPAQARLLLLSTDSLDPADPVVPLTDCPDTDSIELPSDEWRVERLDDNALTLDYASWRKLPSAPWSARPAPVIAIQDYLNSAKYDGPLELCYHVDVAGLAAQRRVFLVIEYPQRYRIRFNGSPIQYAGLPPWRDIRWMPLEVTGLLREGRNEIALECASFQHGDLTCIEDQSARYGTEIESIYLVGDFSVHACETTERPVAPHWQEYGLPPIGVRCFEADRFELIEPTRLVSGDTVSQGLPFYAGTLSYSATLPPLLPDDRWRLEIEQLDAAVAEVTVDGSPIGHFVQHPLEVELPRGCDGAMVTITLYGTLRNLLGPHHHPDGELAAVCPGHFSAEPTRNESGHNDWVFRHERRERLDGWTDRYCMIEFGRIGRARLVRVP